MKQTLGTRLRELRRAKGCTVQDVVNATGCPRATLYRYEKVDDEKVSSLMLHELAKFYNVDVHWLQYGGGFMNAKPQEYTDNRPYIEEPYDFKWAQPMIDAYCSADASTQKAVCAVLGLERIVPQKEELRVEQEYFDQART